MKSKKSKQTSHPKSLQSEKKTNAKKKKSEIKTENKYKNISLSKQKYLDTILELQNKNQRHSSIPPHAHVKDIAAELGIKMASVTGAAKSLEKENLIYYHARKQISLTSKGFKIASELKSKHQTLFKFFYSILQCEKKEAESLACEIEHIIDESVRKKIENLINNIKLVT